MQSSDIVGFGKLVKTRFREIRWQLELRRLEYFEQIRLGGSFWYLCTPTYSLVDYFDLEGHREVFVEFFNFLFDNTSWYYFVFASLFPYSLSFTFTSYCICLCFREQIRFYCVTLTLFPHLVKQSKSNLTINFNLGVLNKLQCFTLFELLSWILVRAS